MIPGFNTDIEHGGITYHVQTEDKGVDSPIILSLVYYGGAILASKRTPYDDLLTAGLDEETLAERLQRQHKLICAAIRSGRIEDLKRMNERATRPIGENKKTVSPTLPVVESDPVEIGVDDDLLDLDPPPPAAPLVTEQQGSVHAKVHLIKKGVADFARESVAMDAPSLTLLEETEIRGGRDLSLRVKLTQGDGDDAEPLAATTITAKIFGTKFAHIECAAQTNGEGIAVVKLSVPVFTSGRAVLLISAIADGHEATLRRVVQPA